MCRHGHRRNDEAMRQHIDITTQPTARAGTSPKRRLGLLSGLVLLSLALIATACSIDNSTSQAAAAPTADLSNPTSDQEPYWDQIESEGFEGVVAVRDGQDITTRAYGIADRENDVPMDTETVFDIGSITKQFTAAAILRLEMDGRLSVEDTLGEHVPGLPAEKAAITLHQLLTHTAGLPVGFGPDDEPIDRSNYLGLVAMMPLLSEPGDRYEYSNVGYSLLAAVIEFETGEPYEAFLRTALFEPAGMLDTGYLLPDWENHTIAVGYDHQTGDRFGRPNEQPWGIDGPYWNLLGNGGLLSTAADMLRWDQALITDDILDAAAKVKLFAPHVSLSPGEDVHYSYGWQIIQTPTATPLIKHDGGNQVFYADFLRIVDQDVAIFIGTNSDDDRVGGLTSFVASQVLDGELAAMFDDEDSSEISDEADASSDAPTDTTVVSCGFDGLSIDSLPDYLEVDAFPNSEAGSTATSLLELLAGGDALARLDFAIDHVTKELAGDDPTIIANTIVDLQELLADYEVVRTLEQDERQFHVLMQGSGPDLLLSVAFDETDPERLACLALSA